MFNNDVVIERFWKNPEKYLPLLKQAKGVIAADYSVMNGLLLNIELPMESMWKDIQGSALSSRLLMENKDTLET